jgi:hypothetical protein
MSMSVNYKYITTGTGQEGMIGLSQSYDFCTSDG